MMRGFDGGISGKDCPIFWEKAKLSYYFPVFLGIISDACVTMKIGGFKSKSKTGYFFSFGHSYFQTKEHGKDHRGV